MIEISCFVFRQKGLGSCCSQQVENACLTNIPEQECLNIDSGAAWTLGGDCSIAECRKFCDFFQIKEQKKYQLFKIQLVERVVMKDRVTLPLERDSASAVHSKALAAIAAATRARSAMFVAKMTLIIPV